MKKIRLISMAKVDFLKKRAEEFFEMAEKSFQKEYFNISAFHLEQACQLYLKYYIALRARKYPKTHFLEELLKGIAKLYKKENEIQKIIDENANLIGDLDQAYLTARYLPVEFNKKRIENMLEFTQGLIQFLKKL